METVVGRDATMTETVAVGGYVKDINYEKVHRREADILVLWRYDGSRGYGLEHRCRTADDIYFFDRDGSVRRIQIGEDAYA